MGPPQRPPAGPWGPAQLPEAGLNSRPPREDITVTPEEGWCLGKDGAGGATSQPARLQPGTGPGWGGEGARKCLFPEPALAMGRKGPARPPSLAPRCRWMRGARGFLPLGTDPSPPWFPSAPHPSPPERPRNTSAHRAEQAWPWARGGGGGAITSSAPPPNPPKSIQAREGSTPRHGGPCLLLAAPSTSKHGGRGSPPNPSLMLAAPPPRYPIWGGGGHNQHLPRKAPGWRHCQADPAPPPKASPRWGAPGTRGQTPPSLHPTPPGLPAPLDRVPAGRDRACRAPRRPLQDSRGVRNSHSFPRLATRFEPMKE